MHVVIAIVVLYLVFHLLAGHSHNRYHRRRGHRINYGWSLMRGPWIRFRIFGGNYYHDV